MSKLRNNQKTDFGRRLEEARTEAELTVEELARRVGMAQSTLTHAENKGAGTSKVASLARECRVNAYWLETGKGDKYPAAQDQAPSGDTGTAMPSLSLEAENLAVEFDEAPLGRSDRARVHRLCLAIIMYGGLPPYTDLVSVTGQSGPASVSTSRTDADLKKQPR